MILSDYGSGRYFIPEEFDIGSVCYITDDDEDELKVCKIVSIIQWSKDPEAYDGGALSTEDLNDYMDSDRSCEVIGYNGDSFLIGMDYMDATDLKVSFYC